MAHVRMWEKPHCEAEEKFLSHNVTPSRRIQESKRHGLLQLPE
jgi:hypothetical protein